LGAVGYYLLCSDYPFKGKDHKDLRENIFKSKGPKYQEKHALSDEAKDFINKCLTVKAKNRPSMQDL
jgi:serine/threonine protein kinase